MTTVLVPPPDTGSTEPVEWTWPAWLDVPTPPAWLDEPSALGTEVLAPAWSVEEMSPRLIATDVRLELVSVNDAGHIVASLPVRFDQRVESGSTAVLTADAAGGVMRIKVTVDSATGRVSTNLQVTSSGHLPADVFEATRFARTFLPGRRIGFARDGRLIGAPTAIPATPIEIPFEIVDTARALAFIQSVTNVEQGFPDELTVGEARAIGEVETLLRGGSVSSRWSSLLIQNDDETIAAMLTDGPVGFEFTTAVTRGINGYTYDLGDGIHWVRVQLDINTEGVPDGYVRLLPAFEDLLTVHLVSPAAKRLNDPYKPFVRVDGALLDAAAQ